MKWIIALLLAFYSFGANACFNEPQALNPENISLQINTDGSTTITMKKPYITATAPKSEMNRGQFEALKSKYLRKQLGHKPGGPVQPSCTDFGGDVDLGYFGVWEWGSYLLDSGFWTYLVSSSFATQQQKWARCQEELERCLAEVNTTASRLDTFCGIAGNGVTRYGGAAVVTLIGVCMGGVALNKQRQVGDCYIAYNKCMALLRESYQPTHGYVTA